MFNTDALHTVLILLSSISVVIDACPVPVEVTTELQSNLVCKIQQETDQWGDCKSFLQEHLSKDSIEYKQLQEPIDPLIHARLGHTELLLRNGLPVNYVRLEDTMLHTAAQEGHNDLVALLLTHGADIEAKGNLGYTPLHKAAELHRTATVKLLLDRGADVNRTNVLNQTAIFLAAMYFEAPTKKMTTNNAESSQNKDELENKKYVSGKSTIDLLLEYGADVNIPDWIGVTPLHFAATHGKLKVVKQLIEKGANINATNINNQTPLHIASRSNNLSVVEYLVRMGCDKTITDSNNKTALDIAKEKKFTEIVDLLSRES